MAIPWSDVEDVCQKWVADVTGVNVIWADQNERPPAGDFITLRLRGPKKLGAFDAVGHFINPDDSDATKLLEYVSRGERELLLSLQAYTSATNRTTAARVHLAKLQGVMDMPSTRARFDAVKLVLIDASEVLNISTLAQADIQGRAAMDVRIRCTDTESEWGVPVRSAQLVPPEDLGDPTTIDGEI